MTPYNLPRSGVLLLGSNSVQSLLPATLTSQIESFLENHRLSDAAVLAEQHRKKLQAKARVEPDERDEVSFIYQRIGFEQFRETLFEEAGRSLFVGDLDPRVLVSYFPELRGDLFGEDDTVDMFAGVAEHMPSEATVDEIIAANLVLNYSPHLKPNTREAAPAVELSQLLRYSAEQAVETFLRMWRFKLRVTDKGKPKTRASGVSTVVDTTLATIYAKTQKTRELHALLSEPNDIVLNGLEDILVSTEQFSALCSLYQQAGQDEKLLEAWSKLADGEWIERDEVAPKLDPIGNIEAMISAKRDRTLTARWAVWLMKKDPDRGLRLILSRDNGKRSGKAQEEEDARLLADIQQVSPAAAQQYLEHLIFQRRSLDLSLHRQFAHLCVDNLLSCLADESIHKLWRAKTSSYISSPPSASFLSYFASTTPDSEAKRTRLKAVLFLQGSALYDQLSVLEKLSNAGQIEILALETAIVQGKLVRHRAALGTLVNTLHDATSAEVYCALGGVLVPAKVAHSLGEAHGLTSWAAVLFPFAKGLAPGALSRQPSGNDDLRKSLIKTLLEVYMDGGEINAGRTARLLNSQAMNMDPLEVISLVSDDWSISSMSSFLTRSFRRTLHKKHEGQIVKNIAMSENMKIKEESWLAIREQGAIIEEIESDDDGEGSEKVILDEKVVEGAPTNDVVEIHNEKVGWDDATASLGLR